MQLTETRYAFALVGEGRILIAFSKGRVFGSFLSSPDAEVAQADMGAVSAEISPGLALLYARKLLYHVGDCITNAGEAQAAADRRLGRGRALSGYPEDGSGE